MHPELSIAEVKHFLLPKEDVIDSYVVEEVVNGEKVITDFFSYYTLPSSVLKHEAIKEMKVSLYGEISHIGSLRILLCAEQVSAREIDEGVPHFGQEGEPRRIQLFEHHGQ